VIISSKSFVFSLSFPSFFSIIQNKKVSAFGKTCKTLRRSLEEEGRETNGYIDILGNSISAETGSLEDGEVTRWRTEVLGALGIKGNPVRVLIVERCVLYSVMLTSIGRIYMGCYGVLNGF
jgi:hypothetical protein